MAAKITKVCPVCQSDQRNISPANKVAHCLACMTVYSYRTGKRL